MNSAGLECVFQEHMYSLHKVLFLAIMFVTLYFNEVESFAVPAMLNNITEVSKVTLGVGQRHDLCTCGWSTWCLGNTWCPESTWACPNPLGCH